MTINDLLSLAGLTAGDEIPVWDAEAVENGHTKKITALNLASAIKTLASLIATTDLDTVPTDGSTKAVQSGGVYDAIAQSSPAPYIATIPMGQWSGSGSDRYITVTASNVSVDAMLYPFYDNASAALLNGPVWVIPAEGSFTIHTSAIPSGTVTISVLLAGIVGEAQYQVLADVYSKDQVDSKIAQSTALVERTVTLASGFSLASWGKVTAYSSGKLLIVSASGVRASAAISSPTTMATVSGISFKEAVYTAGMVEGSGSNTFIAVSQKNSGNINVDSLSNANANMYFSLVATLQ